MYELAHVAAYLLAYLGAALMPGYRALMVYGAGLAVAGAIAGSALLGWRSAQPGRGGWDALGDWLLALMLAGSVIAALLFQALRIRLQNRGSRLAPLVHAGGLLASPAIAIGGLILLAQLG